MISSWDLSDALGFEITKVADPQRYKTGEISKTL
jgi:hypothetical protein